jgi:hypothetical protein
MMNWEGFGPSDSGLVEGLHRNLSARAEESDEKPQTA